MPQEEIKKPKNFSASLVSPEELRKKDIKPPVPPPPVMKKIRPVPLPRKAPAPSIMPKPIPEKPVPAIRQKPIPFPEKPVVPGEGKEIGKPLPEGIPPGVGKSEKSGEGLDARTHPGKTEDDITSTKRGEKDKLSDKPGFLDRAKLFDKGVIGEAARKETSGVHKKDETVKLDTSQYRYAGYNRLLRDKIENSGCWVYPPEAIQRRIYGDVFIDFTIMKNGKLEKAELIRTSGYKMLDDAALRALKDCEPYWPLPDEWGRDTFTVQGHFIYAPTGFFVR